MVNRSVPLILHHSVAKCESEERLAFTVRVGFRIERPYCVPDVDFFLFLVIPKLLANLFLFDFSVLCEKIKSWLPDRNSLLDHVPENTLREWGSCQGALVSPSSVVIEKANKFGQVQFLFLEVTFLLSKHVSQEFIVIIVYLILFEKFFFDSFEQKAQNSMWKLRFVLGKLIDAWVQFMHNMHFQVHQFPINRVLRRCMKVCLQTKECSWLNMLIK